jgi:hypothetical protein
VVAILRVVAEITAQLMSNTGFLMAALKGGTWRRMRPGLERSAADLRKIDETLMLIEPASFVGSCVRGSGREAADP